MNEENLTVKNSDSIKEFIEKIAPYIRIIIQNWKKLLYFNGAVAILSAAVLLLFIKNYYDSTVIILPDYGGGSLLGGLSGLAAVAGISVGETEPTVIYQKLIEGESVLAPVIYKKYNTREFNNPVNLIEYYEIDIEKTDERDPLFLQERDKFTQMSKIFKKNILSTDIDRLTSILTITVRADEQILSSEIANNLVASLDEYVRTKRKSNAVEQRIYIEKRIDQVKDSLRNAEEVLKKFREQNRVIGLSPQLTLDQTRLLRNIEILQTVYIELTKQMELIKLEEVKDAPIVNIREEAGIPIEKAGPKRSIFLVVILFLSLSFSCCWIILKDKIQRLYSLVKAILR